MKRLMLAAAVAAGLTASAAHAESFSIDPMHSSVVFTVRHVVGNVTGRFDKFVGGFTYDPANLKDLKTHATIDAASIDTGVAKRDDDLRSPHFFDVAKYPKLTFVSTGVTDVSGNKAKLHGDLTIHGVTKPVVLDLEMLGIAKDPMSKTGGNRAGGTAKGTVNRADFGVGPTSGPMAAAVGQDITITIEIEGTTQK